jgi:hypothetical protein
MAKNSRRRQGPGTNLDKKGWVGDNGTKGVWTKFADIVVNEINGISLIGDRKNRYSQKGVVSTMGGNDILKGSSSSGPGIYLETAFLMTSDGDDLITGRFFSDAPYDSEAVEVPVILLKNTYLSTGSGNDSITGYSGSYQGGGLHLLNSRIVAHDGNDIISVGGEWWADVGILVGTYSEIEMGEGDDIIESEYGLRVDPRGEIKMEDGNDLIEVGEIGQIQNSGTVDFGSGDDTLAGFGYGSGLFDGGAGSDLLRLPDGQYTLLRSGAEVLITNESLQVMRIAGFEFVGSLSDGFAVPIDMNSIPSGFVIGASEAITAF